MRHNYKNLLLIGVFLFISGCTAKPAVEKERWFIYASKYDCERNTLIVTGDMKYFGGMDKNRKRFLQSTQPTESEIVSVLKSTDRKFQKVGLAALSLKPVETNEVLNLLIGFLQDPNFYFKEYACSALDEFIEFPESRKAELSKELLKIIKIENEKGKHGIAFQEFSLLAKCPSHEAAQFLSDQLIIEGKENKIPRLAAFRALQTMGNPYYGQAAEYVKNNGSAEIQKEFLDRQNFYNDPNNNN